MPCLSNEDKQRVVSGVLNRLGESESDAKLDMNVANLVGSEVVKVVQSSHAAATKVALQGEQELIAAGYDTKSSRVKRFVKQQEQFGELFLKLGNNVVS